EAEVRAIAREAYIYGYPVVEAYKTLYAQAVDQGGPNFKAPFNQIGNTANVFTPNDTAIITPNSDTPYSFVWMDLRAEPLVLTLPPIENKRYYSAQLIDLYTHNFAYLGTRTSGNQGGNYMIVGPDWSGEKP
ncbi:MAG TPA: cell envelope protein, partial [Cupriavidus sp.]|nr:cell envelope protein [Cupriavidus sp.]